MCYYNGQKMARTENIRLKELVKPVADYNFLSRDLQIGFDYNLNAVLKKRNDEEDFDIVQMEWGFIPSYLKTRKRCLRCVMGTKMHRANFIHRLQRLMPFAKTCCGQEKFQGSRAQQAMPGAFHRFF